MPYATDWARAGGWVVIMSGDPYMAVGNRVKCLGSGNSGDAANEIQNETTKITWCKGFTHSPDSISGTRQIIDISTNPSTTANIPYTVRRETSPKKRLIGKNGSGSGGWVAEEG